MGLFLEDFGWRMLASGAKSDKCFFAVVDFDLTRFAPP
jgi:hypothetical protein